MGLNKHFKLKLRIIKLLLIIRNNKLVLWKCQCRPVHFLSWMHMKKYSSAFDYDCNYSLYYIKRTFSIILLRIPQFWFILPALGTWRKASHSLSLRHTIFIVYRSHWLLENGAKQATDHKAAAPKQQKSKLANWKETICREYKYIMYSLHVS